MRVLGELALQTKLSARIALTNGFTVAYDESPPDGIRTYDTELKVGVVVWDRAAVSPTQPVPGAVSENGFL